jgi:hypothetical protein
MAMHEHLVIGQLHIEAINLPDAIATIWLEDPENEVHCMAQLLSSEDCAKVVAKLTETQTEAKAGLRRPTQSRHLERGQDGKLHLASY